MQKNSSTTHSRNAWKHAVAVLSILVLASLSTPAFAFTSLERFSQIGKLTPMRVSGFVYDFAHFLPFHTQNVRSIIRPAIASIPTDLASGITFVDTLPTLTFALPAASEVFAVTSALATVTSFVLDHVQVPLVSHEVTLLHAEGRSITVAGLGVGLIGGITPQDFIPSSLSTPLFSEESAAQYAAEIEGITMPRLARVKLLPLDRYVSLAFGATGARAAGVAVASKKSPFRLFDKLSLSVFCAVTSRSTASDPRCDYDTVASGAGFASPVAVDDTPATSEEIIATPTVVTLPVSDRKNSNEPVYLTSYITKYITERVLVSGPAGRDGKDGKDGSSGVSTVNNIQAPVGIGSYSIPSYTSPATSIGISTIGYLKDTTIENPTMSNGSAINLALTDMTSRNATFNGYTLFNDIVTFSGNTTINVLSATTSTTLSATTTNAYVTNLFVDAATSTDSYITRLVAASSTLTDAMLTNSTTTNAYITSLVAASSTIGDLIVTNATTTNATTTRMYIASLTAVSATTTNFFSTNATSTNFAATNSTTTNATSTNFFATTGTITNATSSTFFSTLLTAITAAFTNLTATNATTTNLTSTNATSTNFAATNASTTNATSTNFFATNGVFTNGTTTNLIITNSSTTDAYIDRLTLGSSSVNNMVISGMLTVQGTTTLATTSMTDLTASRATTTSFFSTLLTAITAAFTNLTATNATSTNLAATNATTTNATTTNFFATNATSTNFAATNASTTNATSTNFFSTLLTAITAAFTNLTATSATTTNLFSTNATVTNGTTTNLFTQNLSVGNASTTGNQSIEGSFAVSGTSTLGSNVYLNGSVVIGTSTSNMLTVNGLVNSNIVPASNISYDLGSPSFYWREIYAGNINVNSISAASTTISGTSNSSFSINSDNVSSDIEDSSLSFTRGVVTPNALFRWSSTNKRLESNMSMRIMNETPTTGTTTLTIQSGAGQGSSNLLQFLNNAGTGVLSAFNASGWLGIGSSTPGSALSVIGNGYFGGSLTATGTLAVSGTSTLATTTITSGSIDALTSTNATSTNFAATNATTTNATSTNLFATNATSTNFAATNATTTNATSTNLFTTNATSTNFAATNSTTTNATSTNFFATSGTITNATSSTIFSTLINAITGVFSSLTGGTITATSSLVSQGTLAVTGNSTLTGDVNASSTLGVTGATNLYSTLGVVGALSASSTLGVTGATNLYSTLNVTGQTTLTTASSTGLTATNLYSTTANLGAITGTTGLFTSTLNASSTLGVTGATRLYSTLDVTGATVLSSTLNVTGQTTLTTASSTGLTTTGATFLAISSGNVGIGTTTPSNKLHVSGTSAASAISVDNHTYYGAYTTAGLSRRLMGINASNHVYLGAIDDVGGSVFIREDAIDVISLVGGNVGIGTTTPGSKLSVQGGSYLGGDVIATGTLALAGALNASSTLGLTGAATFFSTLRTVGGLNASSTLGVTGATNLYSTLNVTGATTLSNTLAVTGALNASSTLGVTDTAIFFSTLRTVGGLNASSTLGVTGATNLYSTLNVTGQTTLTTASSTGLTATNLYSTTANLGAITGTSLNLGSGAVTSGLINGQTISSTANFTGSLAVAGALNASSTLAVTDAALFFSTLRAVGGLNASSTLGVTGATNLYSTLNVTGQTTLATASSTGLTATNLYATTATVGTLALTNASTTNLTVSNSAYFGGNTGIWNGSGNVGIGTTTPAVRFQVDGTFTATGLSELARFVYRRTDIADTDEGSYLSFRVEDDNNQLTPFDHARISWRNNGTALDENEGELGFWTANNGVTTEQMTITSTGFVGIGTTTPGSLFSVQGSSYLGGNVIATGTLALAGALSASSTLDVTGAVNLFSTLRTVGAITASSTFGLTGAATLHSTLNVTGQTTLTTASTTGLTVSSSAFLATSGGGVGIGTTTPQDLLSLAGTLPMMSIDRSSGSANSYLKFSQASVAKAYVGIAGTTDGIVTGAASGDLALQSVNQKILFSTDAGLNAAMTISAVGNVGIGTTSPVTTLAMSMANIGSATLTNDIAKKLGIFIAGTAGNTSDFIQTGISFAEGNSGMYSVDAGASGAQHLALFTGNTTAVTERMRITSAGLVGIGTTTPATTLQVVASSNAKISVTRSDGTFYNQIGDTGSTDDGGFFAYDSSGALTATLRGEGHSYVNGGSFGIGDTAPRTSLEINADDEGGIIIYPQAAGEDTFIRLTEVDDDFRGSFIQDDGANNILKIGVHQNTDSATSSDVVAIAIPRISGFVGIGTTTPTSLLSLASTTAGLNTNLFTIGTTTALFKVTAGGFASSTALTATTLYSTTATIATLGLTNASTTNLTVSGNAHFGGNTGIWNSSGNVGIGTTTPGAVLHVVGNSSYNSAANNTLRFGDASSPTRFVYAGYDETVDAGFIQSINSGTAYTSLLLNPNGGNVGIGTSTPAAHLHVDETFTATGLTELARFVHRRSDIGDTDDGSYLSFKVEDSNNGASLFDHARISWRNNGTGADENEGELGFWTATNGVETEQMTINSTGNVGIGTTTPGYKFHVLETSTGNIAAFENDFGSVQIGAPSSLVNYIQSRNSTDSGYQTVGFKTSSTIGLVLDTSGNVGIGTTTPTERLELHGDNIAFVIQDTDTSLADEEAAGAISFKQNDASGTGEGARIGVKGSGTTGLVDLGFYTGGNGTVTEKLTITNGGRVGIGVTTPSYFLDLAAENTNAYASASTTTTAPFSTSDPVLRLRNTASTLGGQSGILFSTLSGGSTNSHAYITSFAEAGGATAAALAFGARTGSNAYSEFMRIDDAGNVGIGTSTPSAMLHVQAGGTANPSFAAGIAGIFSRTSGVANLAIVAANTGASNLYFSDTDSENPGYIQYDHTSNFMRFITNANERLRIDSSGNIGVGTSTPLSKFTISGSNNGATTNNTLTFEDSDTTTQANQQLGRIDFYSHDTSSPGAGVKAYILAAAEGVAPQVYLAFGTDVVSGTASERMRITSEGNVGIGTTTPLSLLTVSSSTANGTSRLFNVGTTTSIFSVLANGNVGIGTTTPDYKLTVFKSTNASVGIDAWNSANTDIDGLVPGTQAGGLIVGGTNAHMTFGLRDNDSNDSFQFLTGGGDYMTNSTFDTVAMSISSGGNVGIGTTTPLAKLHITNGYSGISSLPSAEEVFVESNSTTNFKLGSTDAFTSNYNLGSPSDESGAMVKWDFTNKLMSVGPTLNSADGELALLYGNGSEALRVNATGNVGVGTSTIPSGVKLAVAGNTHMNGWIFASSTAPVFVGNATSTGALDGIEGVAVQGKYAYVTSASTTNNFSIIDVSAQDSPVIVSTITASAGTLGDVIVNGRYTYVAGTTANAFYVIDVSNPVAPAVVGSIVSGSQLEDTEELYLSGKYVYTASRTDDLITIIDVSDPTKPVVAGTYSGNTTDLNDPWDIAVQGRFAYVSVRSDSTGSVTGSHLSVFDISNPNLPVLVATTTATSTMNDTRGIYVSGRYLYAASITGDSLSIFDVSNPRTPTIVGSITSAALLDGAYHVKVVGKYAYVSINADDGIAVVDVSNPALPVYVDRYTDSSGTGSLDGVVRFAISGSYLYGVGQTGDIFTILRIGSELPSLSTGNLAATNFSVEDSMTVNSDLLIGNGLSVGGNLYSAGGITSFLSGTSTTAGDKYGLRSIFTDTGVVTTGTDNVYGVFASTTRTGATGGTINSYGGYFLAGGSTGGTSRAVGLYASAAGADDNYAAIFDQGNVGIGTSSPFSKLDVTSTSADLFALERSSTQVGRYEFDITNVYGGAIASLNIANVSTSNTPDIAFRASSTGNAQFILTNAGNVGIGTTSPITTLAMTMANVASATLTNDRAKKLGIFIEGTAGNTADFIQTGISFAEGNSGMYSVDAGSSAAQHIVLFTGNSTAVTERMRITSDGNVGIGTTSPVTPFAVSGTNAVAAVFQRTDSTNLSNEFRSTAGSVFVGMGAHGFSVDNDNNIGDLPYFAVGTTTGFMQINNMNGVDSPGAIRFGRYDTTGRFHEITTQVSATLASNWMDFAISNSTTATSSVMRLLGNGNVGIGTTTPLSLLVVGSSTASGTFNMFNVATTTSIFSVVASGNVGIGTTTPGSKLDVVNPTSSSNVSVFQIITNVATAGVKFRIDSDGDLFTDGSTTIGAGADVAESYAAVEALDAGMVVAFASTTTEWSAEYGSDILSASSTDVYEIAGVRKATHEYEAVGVVSTRPGLHLGANIVNGVPIALAGRVPVKVTTENGVVKKGDYITVSRTVPGHAMKLTGEGKAIARAISDYVPASGKVMAYIEAGFQKLDTNGKYATTTGMLTTGNVDLNANAVAIYNIKSLASANGTWSIDEDGRITARVLCLEDVCIDKTQLSNILNSTGQSGVVAGTSTSQGGSSTPTPESTPIDGGTGTTTPNVVAEGGSTGETEPASEPTPTEETPTEPVVESAPEPVMEPTPEPAPSETVTASEPAPEA